MHKVSFQQLAQGFLAEKGFEDMFFPQNSFSCSPKDPWDWYIYLHEWLIVMVDVGKYTIHGSCGIRVLTSSIGVRV